MKGLKRSGGRDVGDEGGRSAFGSGAAGRRENDLLRLSYVCHASGRLCGRPGRGIVLAEIHRRFDAALGRVPTAASLADLVRLIEGASGGGPGFCACSAPDVGASSPPPSAAEKAARPS